MFYILHTYMYRLLYIYIYMYLKFKDLNLYIKIDNILQGKQNIDMSKFLARDAFVISIAVVSGTVCKLATPVISWCGSAVMSGGSLVKNG